MIPSIYKYYTLYRPPMPGTVPRQGLIHVMSCSDRIEIEPGVMAWGYVEYDRQLTEEEIRDYELKPSQRNRKENQE